MENILWILIICNGLFMILNILLLSRNKNSNLFIGILLLMIGIGMIASQLYLIVNNGYLKAIPFFLIPMMVLMISYFFFYKYIYPKDTHDRECKDLEDD